jgi:hypothetical protein
MFDGLTFEQLRLVVIVYSSAIIPLLAIPILHHRKLIPSWVLPFYIKTFFLCLIGWEIWFNYGLVAGDSVNIGRADVLDQMIPLHINGLLNSLADAGTICCGTLLVWLAMGRQDFVYRQWSWKVFSLLLVVFLEQNIMVEMFLYHDQLADGKMLSWAPLSPAGQWFNPVLWEFQRRSIMLASQLPWLIATPLIYEGLIRSFKSPQRAFYTTIDQL